MRQQRSSHIQHRPYHKSHPGQSPITWFFPSASSITRISTHIPQILPRWTSQALSTLVFLQTTSSVLVPSRLLMQQLKLLFLVCDVVQILLHASLLAYLRLSEWPSVLLQVFIIVYFLVPLTYLLVTCWTFFATYVWQHTKKRRAMSWLPATWGDPSPSAWFTNIFINMWLFSLTTSNTWWWGFARRSILKSCK